MTAHQIQQLELPINKICINISSQFVVEGPFDKYLSTWTRAWGVALQCLSSFCLHWIQGQGFMTPDPIRLTKSKPAFFFQGVKYPH